MKKVMYVLGVLVFVLCLAKISGAKEGEKIRFTIDYYSMNVHRLDTLQYVETRCYEASDMEAYREFIDKAIEQVIEQQDAIMFDGSKFYTLIGYDETYVFGIGEGNDAVEVYMCVDIE